MADNTTLNAGTGGDVCASDDIGGVKHQRVKLSVGADGAANDAVPVSNGMDVTGAAVQAVGLVAQFDDVSVGTVTENQFAPVRMSTRRALLVEGVPSGTAQPVSLASVTPGTGASDLGKAEDAAHSSGDVGVMALGVRAAAPTDRSAGPTDGDYVPLGVNEVGAQWVSQTHSANGGASTMNASSSDGATALTNTAQAIKASAGSLVGYFIYNPNSAAVFVQFYNTASGSVTVGTTSPLFMLTIPPFGAANLWMPGGIAFATAMSWAATSTAGGNSAPTTALGAVAWYK